MTESTSDSRLIEAVARGELEAFEDFYARFSRPLYALGLRWLHDATDAEDLVSDTMVRAWQHAGRFDATRGDVSSWLFGIARHAASDRRRANSRHQAAPLDHVAEPSQELDTDGLGDAFDLAVALGHLTPAHREVLVLTYARDQSESQIARHLGIPLGTVKSRRFHALRSMAGLMRDPAHAGTSAEPGER